MAKAAKMKVRHKRIVRSLGKNWGMAVQDQGEFERVGTSQTRRANVRLVAATNRDLRDTMAHGRFRADLFYRLHVFPIHLPPAAGAAAGHSGACQRVSCSIREVIGPSLRIDP